MGTVMSPFVYLSLLLPAAWALLASVRRWRRGARSKLRIRVYPGSPEHVAVLRAVEWRLRSGRGPAERG